MKIKEVYDRIGVSKAREPSLAYLPNHSDVLKLVEVWDGGPMEGQLFIQKDNGEYIIYEIVHHFNSKSETVYKHILQNDTTIQNVVKEIEDFCKIRYEGTLNFNFAKIKQEETLRSFFGF